MTASSHLHVPQFASLRRMASFSKRAPTPEPAPIHPSIQGILLLEPVDVDASFSLDFNKPLPAPPPPRAVSPAPEVKRPTTPKAAGTAPPARAGGTIALLEPISFAAPLSVDFTVSRIPRPSNASADGRMPALPSTQTKTTIVSRKRVPVPSVEPAPKPTPVAAPVPAPAASRVPMLAPVKAKEAPSPPKPSVTPAASPSKKPKSPSMSSPFRKAKSSSSPPTSPKKKTGASSLIISKPIAIPARVESPLERSPSPPPRKAPTPPAVASPIKRASSPAAAPKAALSVFSTPERVSSPAPRKDMGSSTSSLKPASRVNPYMPGPPPKPVRSSSRPEPLETAAAAALRHRTRMLSPAASTTTLSSYSSDEAISIPRDSQDGEDTPATTMSPGASDIEDIKLPRGRTSSSSFERTRRSSSTPPKPPSSFRGAPALTLIFSAAKDDSSTHVNLYALPSRPAAAKRASSVSGIARSIRKRTSFRRLFTAPTPQSGCTSEEEPATALDDEFEFVARGDTCANGAPLRLPGRRVLLVSAPAGTSELVAFDAVRGYCEAWGKVSTIARASSSKKDRALRLRVEFRDPAVCERVLAEAGESVRIPDVGRVALALK